MREKLNILKKLIQKIMRLKLWKLWLKIIMKWFKLNNLFNLLLMFIIKLIDIYIYKILTKFIIILFFNW